MTQTKNTEIDQTVETKYVLLSKRIKSERIQRKWTQSELAFRADTTFTTVSKLETRIRVKSSHALIIRLTCALKIPIDDSYPIDMDYPKTFDELEEHVKNRLENIPKNIKRFRVDRGLTQTQLAKRMGIGISSILFLEKRQRTMFSHEILIRASLALDVPMSTLELGINLDKHLH